MKCSFNLSSATTNNDDGAHNNSAYTRITHTHTHVLTFCRVSRRCGVAGVNRLPSEPEKKLSIHSAQKDIQTSGSPPRFRSQPPHTLTHPCRVRIPRVCVCVRALFWEGAARHYATRSAAAVCGWFWFRCCYFCCYFCPSSSSSYVCLSSVFRSERSKCVRMPESVFFCLCARGNLSAVVASRKNYTNSLAHIYHIIHIHKV